MKEECFLKINFKKAKEWYNNNSQYLKRIALEVYTEEAGDLI